MQETKINEIEINGMAYVPKTNENVKAESLDGMPYVIVRAYGAGVFAGYIKKREGKEVLLVKARRLWYWSGAASLSQAAMEGFSKPTECKFPCEVDEILLLDAIEILTVTEKAKKSIAGVKTWIM